MDEPFSALDPLIRTHLQDELLALQRSLRKTIIFVSHDLDEAIKIGTHIAIMEGGRIVQSGAPEEIVLNPASRYVAEFVAHMNPLQVLTCGSLMRRVERTPLPGNAIQFDGVVERLAPQSEVVARPRLSLKDAIRIRQRTGRPVLIGDAGTLIGVIGDDEIYAGIVRQTEQRESLRALA